MAVFSYEGRSRFGTTEKGTLEAPNLTAAQAELRKRQLEPIKLRQRNEKPLFALDREIEIGFLAPRVKPKEVVVLTRQLATMIDAGLPLVQSLEILGRQRANPTLSRILFEVKASVEGGSTFAEAISQHPRVFDELFVSLVEAGEIGGILDTILNRLAAFMEKAIKLKRQVKGAMIYPASIVTVAVAVTAVILVFVIPTFEKMFDGMGANMPLPTQLVINLSNFVQSYFLLLLGGAAVAVVSLRQVYRTDSGRRAIDSMALSTPILGTIVQKVSVARFTRTLGTMVSSGVPILDALTITARTAGNRTIEDAILHARSEISEGRTIAVPLEETGVFPEMVVQMIGVGEATGSMDTMLQKIADFYEDEVDTAVKGLTALLEPGLMLFLGVTVGGLIIAMYLPLFSIFQNF